MSKPQEIFAAASAAATAAIREYVEQYGEAPYNCGFAWVRVKPARGEFIKWCKAQGDERQYGSAHWESGWCFWGPGDWPSSEDMGFQVYGQDMDAKAAGARAFARVLEENGIHAEVGTRLD